MADLEALAVRCEQATGSDRNLDAMIHFAILNGVGSGYPSSAPAYTASIDSALTLVPEGWWLAGLKFAPEDFRSTQDREWHAEFGGPVTWATSDGMPESQFDCEGGNAATPALAICAAALRAKANQETR